MILNEGGIRSVCACVGSQVAKKPDASTRTTGLKKWGGIEDRIWSHLHNNKVSKDYNNSAGVVEHL